jgi:hypothetical protein
VRYVRIARLADLTFVALCRERVGFSDAVEAVGGEVFSGATENGVEIDILRYRLLNL